TQLRRWVDALAADLHRAGVRQGERVSVGLPNRVEAAVALLACSRNGYVCCPSLHQNYTVAEMAQLAERTQSTALIGKPGYGADAARASLFDAVRGLSSLRIVYSLDPCAGTTLFPVCPDADTRASDEGPEADTNPDKVVYLAFTSGTTGSPKGVMHSDNTLLANARAMVEDWGHDEHTVLYSMSPLSHHIGTVAIQQTLVAGCEMVISDIPSDMTPLQWIVAAGATYVMGVPTHGISILAEIRKGGLRQLGDVKVFYMAGSVIPPETAESFLAMGITPQNVYGMTENGSHQYTLPGDPVEVVTTTCGKACAGYETRLWDAEKPDTEAPPGDIGEIGTRGALLMLGYFDDQTATERSFNSSGWFMSGDLGRFDAHGNLQIVGRKKDLIIRGGHNIHPARIENLALRHPAVLKAAAFPVPDHRLGERACVAVVPREGEAVDGERLLAHLDAMGLSKYDMPEYFLSLESFPLTASGKILKRELVEWTKIGKVKPVPVRWTAKA
ncbi:MAG: acyl--CoA ligase, partial [Proteobacteria bacterium]|nr:acyl--CoA ligase [Burkholderiales bacterium]